MSLIIVASSGIVGWMLLIMLPLAVILLAKAADAVSHHLLIKHTPTSDCGGVLPGLVEVKGTVAVDEALQSPLTDREVVYFDYDVEEEFKTSSDKSSWKTIAEESAKVPHFYLRDETGRIRVDLSGAEIHPAQAVDQKCRSSHELYARGGDSKGGNSRGVRKFREEHLAVGDEIYVFGTADDCPDLGIPQIGAGDDSDPFIVSTRDESDVADRYFNRAAWQFVVGGAMATSIPVLGTVASEGVSVSEALDIAILPTFLVGLGVVGLIWAIYRLKHSEHLEDLRLRVNQSRQLLQRECRHRENCIEEVAAAIRDVAGRRTKSQIDDWITQRRERALTGSGRISVRRLCTTIDEQTEVLDKLFQIAEGLQELESDPAFYLLLEELTRCEKQITMARNFYNEGIWRMTREPEAATGDLPATNSTDAMTFRRFERKPIDIVLPEDPDSEYGGDFEQRPTEKPPERDPPPTPADPPPTPAEPPEVPEDSASESEDDGEPDVLAAQIGDTDTGVTMRFGSSEGFAEPASFKNVGQYGKSRSFDEIGMGWDFGDDNDAEREAYGFGVGERASLSQMQWPSREEASGDREPYGFSAADRRRVDGFSDDE